MILVTSIQHTGTWFTIELCRLIEKEVHQHHLYTTGEDVAHDDKPIHRTPEQIMRICNRYWNIVPIRDPLAAVITRDVRLPHLSHCYIIEAMCWLAETHSENPFNAFYVPIDLLGSQEVEDRLRFIAWMFGDYGITTTSEELFTFVSEWKAPLYNVSLPSDLKADYRLGNYVAIKAALPMETGLLEKKCDILQPFFEEFGYRNLLWFNK